ncbi:Tetratricopeptide repeat-containing protein [Flavobacterium aquidurense]|uniref:Tetratricopeptide repeat-containing protein n=1 Tax=Flavobacterium frigidimaris TaxID=262320 RepID=A0ABX4BVB3_FLAFR|nr:tetratricopeptide repeat protein [Flavobacterium frigidimaris]OXA82005.1 hypothetical protein B0A65_01185 [Flavobacterium frigidimaris]SDY57762.1 Tetratricopeptide repeat-containing protein [Flavobacterium aquidurense]
MQLYPQNNPIKLSSSANQIKNIEALLLQEKSFDKDTLALKNFLKPLNQTKQNQIIYEALLANGFSNYYNNLNKKSDWHYQQSIKKASAFKNPFLESWTQLNYVYYLYHNRDYVNLTPMLLKITDRIEQIDPKQLILAGESFKKIGWMMQTFGDYENSFHYFDLAKRHTTKKTSEYVAILDGIGMNYFRIEKLKQAESYFQQTALLATQIHDEVRYAKAIGNLAQVKQKKGDYKSAIDLLKKDIRISENNKNDQNTMYASVLLAKLYILTKNFDKAEQTLNNIQNIVHSKSYFEKLEFEIIRLKLEILKKQNKTNNELQLRRRMLTLEDSLKTRDSDEAINQANWMIQKSQFQNNINKKETKLKEEYVLRTMYVSIIVFVIALGLVLLHFSKKKQKASQFEYDQTVNLLETEKKNTEKKLYETHANLNDHLVYLREKNSQIKKLNIEIDNIKRSSSYNLEKKSGKLNTLLQSHLMTEENWENFKREFQKEYPDFYFKLQKDFPEITDSNKRILLLQKLNFNNTEIAGILGITSDAVKKSKQRIKKKIGVKFKMLFDNVKA